MPSLPADGLDGVVNLERNAGVAGAAAAQPGMAAPSSTFMKSAYSLPSDVPEVFLMPLGTHLFYVLISRRWDYTICAPGFLPSSWFSSQCSTTSMLGVCYCWGISYSACTSQVSVLVSAFWILIALHLPCVP